jgi:putative ABC transport system permease protein
VLETRAEIHGPDGRRSILMIGVTADFAEANGRLTQRLSTTYLAGQRAIGLPAPLANSLGLSLGQLVAITIAGRRVAARLGALLQRDQIGDLVDPPLGLAPLAYQQALIDEPGRVSRIFVVPRPGRDAEVARQLDRLAGDRLNVRPARFESDVFRQASLPTNQSTTMFSVFSALVGFLFAFSAVLLTVPDRRRLIADLTREGYTPRTVLKVMSFDALVLGVLGAALGIAIGDQVSRRLFAETPSFLELAFTFGPQRVVTIRAVAVAALGGIAASCFAVWS